MFKCPQLVIALCASIAPATAHAVDVNCGSGQTISAAIAKQKPETNYVTFNVSGTCTENITIPPNLALILNGAKSAQIKPATASQALIYVEGKLTINTIALVTGTAPGIFVTSGGFALLQGENVTGPGVGLQVQDNAGAIVQNSTINVSGYTAVSTYAGGNVEVDGTPAIGSATGSSLTGASNGINCQPGGSISLSAFGGPINVSHNGGDGLYATGCAVTAGTANGQTITFTNNGASGIQVDPGGSLNISGVNISSNTGNGLSVGPSTSVKLTATQISNNGQYGIYAGSSSVQLAGAVTITGNAGIALQSSQGANFQIDNFSGGVNTISEAANNTNVLFGCYQGGNIYVQQISGYITPAPTQANIGCLHVGGP